MKLKKGDPVPAFQAEIAYDQHLSNEDLKGHWVHIAFHRYAGCPICNLSLREFASRVSELENANIRHYSVFHSPAEKMRLYYPELPPFRVILDPAQSLYEKFGVENSLAGYLNPLSAVNLIRSFTTDFKKRFDPDGDSTTMPADFLIDPEGRIVDVHYGEYVGDSWKVEEVLSKASSAR